MFIAGLGTATPPKQYTQVQCWEALQEAEHLDALILARAAGAEVWQPWALTRVEKTLGGFVGAALAKDILEITQLKACIIIAAHGSWESAKLSLALLKRAPVISPWVRI